MRKHRILFQVPILTTQSAGQQRITLPHRACPDYAYGIRTTKSSELKPDRSRRPSSSVIVALSTPVHPPAAKDPCRQLRTRSAYLLPHPSPHVRCAPALDPPPPRRSSSSPDTCPAPGIYNSSSSSSGNATWEAAWISASAACCAARSIATSGGASAGASTNVSPASLQQQWIARIECEAARPGAYWRGR